MGLLTILKKQRLKDKEMRILMLGLDNAGKTTIVKSILGEDIHKVSPTLGFSIQTVNYQDTYKLNIWDVGGQATLRPFWRNYFEKTDFLIWVIDATALTRLDDCRTELHKTLNEDRLIGAGLLVWINKLDTLDETEIEKIIPFVEKQLNLEALRRHHNLRVLGCSAYSGLNLQEGLDYVVSEVKGRLYALD
ncbi:GTP-binding protein Cin4p [Trichomonascus vanleenenianus]|uniref:GTP-binding protein Cin4p n=1 Tax=Trichomonascus vanleenenianus TaxID=2268995 RepID=UPI003ECA7D4E